MQTSARNQFPGIVTRVERGAVNDEVEITLPGGQVLVAVVTRRSAESLGLAVGGSAVALIKASSVILATDTAGMRFSARNALAGRIARVTPGAVNAEVVIDLPGGLQVAAIVTQASADRMALAAGQPVTALFKASSVIVAVPA